MTCKKFEFPLALLEHGGHLNTPNPADNESFTREKRVDWVLMRM